MTKILLTTNDIKAITKPGYRGVGDNLYVRTFESGNQIWVFRYRIGRGTPQDENIGSLDDINLDKALAAASRMRAERQEGKDPRQEARKRRHVAVNVKTFKECASAWLQHRREQEQDGLLSKGTITNDAKMLKHLLPTLAKLPVEELDIVYVKNCLQPKWRAMRQSARNIRATLEKIIDFAVANQWRTETRENPARKKLMMAAQMPKPARPKKKRALHWDSVHSLLVTLEAVKDLDHEFREYRGSLLERTRRPMQRRRQACALRLLVLTGVRPHNIMQARREHFDYARKEWIIPGEMMKGPRADPPPDHYVPLSDAALKVLDDIYETYKVHGIDGSEPGPLFPANPPSGRWRDRDPQHMTWGGADLMLYENGLAERTLRMRKPSGKYVASPYYLYSVAFDFHGFRSTLSTWANEQRRRDPDTGELIPRFAERDVDRVLAHDVRIGAEKSYNQAQRIALRRVILDAWGAFCSSPPAIEERTAAENVIDFAGAVRLRRSA